MPEVPFSVILASYCVEYHDRNLCSQCDSEGCPRLADAALTLDKFRAERLERHRLRKGSL
ncbi:hypothetical protein [Micromonospora aurantiaca (nom. illeg.)]|uniref:hypothetical protein n=1 Tax=Micromonospora aurantiaca (nom. illeg.) TaxID=47850 RepID=UPI0033F34BB6